MSKTIPLAQYIFRRLHELNCKSIHGVPGDFFLRALDHTSTSPRTYVALLVSIPQEDNAEPKPLMKGRSVPSQDMALLVLSDKLALRATACEQTCKFLGNDV